MNNAADSRPGCQHHPSTASQIVMLTIQYVSGLSAVIFQEFMTVKHDRSGCNSCNARATPEMGCWSLRPILCKTLEIPYARHYQ